MSDRAVQIAAATALIAAMPECEFPRSKTTDKHEPVSGRVIGSDNGKGRKTQPRNAPCECGSGLKSKRCCVYFRQVEDVR